MKMELTQAAAVGSYSFTILMIVVGAVVVAAFIWAACFRKPDDKHAHHHRRHHGRSHKSKDSKSEDGQKSKSWFGSKRRRRKRKERPTNPTLAETGGLPPMRAEDPNPPSQN